MGLAVVEAAFDGGADAGGDGGVYGIEIEAHVNEVGAVGDPGQRLLHHAVDAVAVDVRHRMDLDARLLEPVLLALVQAPDPHEGDVRRVHLGRAPADRGELLRPISHQRGHRHSVDIPRG